jgi:hypothetical protein
LIGDLAEILGDPAVMATHARHVQAVRRRSKMAWPLKAKRLLAATATILLSAAANAEEPVQCSPKDNTVRILKSANPNDTAPGWKLAIVPTTTSFTVKRAVTTDAGKYFQGDLISTHGGKFGRNLFILAQEWDCKGS